MSPISEGSDQRWLVPIKQANLINSWRLFHGGFSKMRYGHECFVFKILKKSKKKLWQTPNEVTPCTRHDVRLRDVVHKEQREGKI